MMKEPSRLMCAVMLVVLHLAIVLPLMNMPAIGGSSEAREAHVVKRIAITNEWILPTRNGLIPSKPPLFHWVGATLTHIGLDPLYAARATSALFGSGVLLLTFLLAGLLVHPKKGGDDWDKTVAGFLAMVVLTTILMFEHMFGEARVDMAFTLFSTLAIFSLVHFAAKSEGELAHIKNISWHFPLFFLACGFSVLARGPGALPFILVLAFTVLVWLGGIKFGARALIKPRWSWLIVIGLSVPWYILAFGHGGQAFLSKQVVFEIFNRISGSEHIKSEPFWFYLPSFALRTLPWIILFLIFAINDFRGIVKLKGVLSRQEIYARRLGFSPVIWVISGIFLLSIVSGKRHSYVLPLLPPLAAYLGACCQRWIAELCVSSRQSFERVCRSSHFLVALLALILIFTIELARFTLPDKFLVYSNLQAWLLGHATYCQAGLSAVLLLSILISKIHTLRVYAVSIWLLVIFVYNFSVYGGTAIRSYIKDFPEIAAAIAQTVGDTKLTVVRTERQEFFDPVLYYLPIEADRVEPDHLELNSNSAVCAGFVLARKAWFDRFQASSPSNAQRISDIREFYSWFDRTRAKTDDGMVVFKCSSGVNAQSTSGSRE